MVATLAIFPARALISRVEAVRPDKADDKTPFNITQFYAKKVEEGLMERIINQTVPKIINWGVNCMRIFLNIDHLLFSRDKRALFDRNVFQDNIHQPFFLLELMSSTRRL